MDHQIRMMRYLLLGALFLAGCNYCNKPAPPSNTTPAVVNTPTFNADSAYSYVRKQVEFGPRVPNTEAHVKCGNWLDSTLRQYADAMYLQTGQVEAFDGTKLNFKNIVAAFNPAAKQRIFLCAHWDTRPFAGQDDDA